MTDDSRTAEAKKTLTEDNAARKKAADERAAKAAATHPTPTQEENDLAALGVPVDEHADDGSGPDPNAPQAKNVEAKKPGGGYQTRSTDVKK
jgi:hypothetical protein